MFSSWVETIKLSSYFCKKLSNYFSEFCQVTSFGNWYFSVIEETSFEIRRQSPWVTEDVWRPKCSNLKWLLFPREKKIKTSFFRKLRFQCHWRNLYKLTAVYLKSLKIYGDKNDSTWIHKWLFPIWAATDSFEIKISVALEKLLHTHNMTALYLKPLNI